MTSDLTARARALFIQLNGYDAVAADEPIGLSELALIESALRAVREETRQQCAREVDWMADGIADLDDLNKPLARKIREIAQAIREKLP